MTAEEIGDPLVSPLDTDPALPPFRPSHGASLARDATINKPSRKLSERQPHECQNAGFVVYGAMPNAQNKALGSLTDEEFKKAVGKRLEMSRKLVDRTRSRIAAEFKVDGQPIFHTTWRKWEIGESLPNMRVLAEFCLKHHFTTDWILLGRFETLDHRLQLIMWSAYPELLREHMANLEAQKSGPAPPPQPETPAAEDPISSLLAGPKTGRRKRGTVGPVRPRARTRVPD